MTALDHRTDPGFSGWGPLDIDDRVTSVAAWRAERAGEDVTAAPWPERIERAAALIDCAADGACQAGVHPVTLFDRLPDIVSASLDAVEQERLADSDADVDPAPPAALRQRCTRLVVRAKTPLPVGRRDGDELGRWAGHVAAALATEHPEVRQAWVRGRGGTRRQLHLVVVVPRDRRPAEYVRGLVEAVAADPLPSLPRLEVLVTVQP